MLSIGLLLVVLSGLCNGLFTAPMKMEMRWKWENIWLVFILTSCVVMPWLSVPITAKGFPDVFAHAPHASVAAASVFGFAWGFGAICFGRSVDVLGVSLANSLVLGVSSALGSLAPLLLARSAASTSSVAVLMAGVAAFLVGIALCGAAGRLRDAGNAMQPAKTPVTGYVLAATAGVLSAVFNIGYSLALPIAETGVQMGFSQTAATNCIWLLMLGAGSLPNIGYCLVLMHHNESRPLLTASGALPSWLRSISMGLLWGGSIFLYGAATPKLGDLGPSVGWPLSLAVALLVANLMGLLLGEWRLASPPARRRMVQGIWMLLGAIVLCAIASRLGS
jgi:L-rhamnose-H+ transport protein